MRCLRRIFAASTSRHLGRDRTVGPDFERQLVVVGLLADAGFFDVVPHAGHGAEHRVDRNDADLLNLLAVLGGRDVAAAVFDDHLDDERHVGRQRGDEQVLVDDLDRLVGFDVAARTSPAVRRSTRSTLVESL